MVYIGKKGYTIVKDEYSMDELQQFRTELTVKPNQNINGYMSSIQYPIYRESTHKMYLPRYYGIEKLGVCEKNTLSKGRCIDLSFQGTLFEYQEHIIQKFIDHVKDSGGGLLDVEPGKGKTVMGLNIISKLKTKTLIITQKLFSLPK